MAKVAMVSSIDLPIPLLNAIKTPVTAAGHTWGGFEHASGFYDANSKKKMRKAVKRLITATSPNSDLLIAVGGLVAARALSDYIDSHDDIPFLICVGRAPNEGSTLWDNDQFVGGINLDTANQNTARATLLMQQFTTISSVDNICLYYNKNSHMAAREAKDWSFFGLLKESNVDQSAGYNANQFKDDLKSLPRGTQAIIVSSDPFFTSKAADLTAAVPAAQFVCYPNASYQAQAGKSIIYGPDLATAYGALAAKAIAYLAAPNPNMGLDTALPVTTIVPVPPAGRR